MNFQKSTLTYSLMLLFFFFTLSFSSINGVSAQDPDCEVSVENGLGYTTVIKEVVDLGGGNYTNTISIKFDGCPGPGCKNVSYIAVEAEPGTYSNVEVDISFNPGCSPSVNMGPNLGGVPFQGFKITGLGNFGKINGAELIITYDLTGGLQEQKTLVKAGSKKKTAELEEEDFQSVLDCNSSNVFPYYPPPVSGKSDPTDCPILGPELCSFYDTYINLGTVVTDDIFQTDGTIVLITVKAEPNQITTLANTLTSATYGMVNELIDLEEYTVTGWYPIDNLWLITELIGTAHEAHPGFTPLTSSGLVTSQGDAAMRADISRDVFGLGGDGVKIGVLSDSYNTKPGDPANDDVVKGDLPGIGFDAGGNPVPNPLNDTDVDVLMDYAATASDEGRAMLQIIHDVAPQADLAFRTAFRSDIDFANGILELRDAGCDIIVDDVTYIEEPFFRDGVIAQAVETVVADGVSYFSAAGNYGTSGYISPFNGVPAPSGLTGQAHNFAGTAGTDVYQNVSVPEGNYTLVMQFDDGAPYGDAVADLDIYLAKDDGSPLFGFNRNNTNGRQLEVLPFTVGEGGAETNIIVINASETPNVTFQYVVFRGQMTQNEWANTTAPTLVGQANAENAIAVGAVLYTNTPEYGNPPTPASFSSRGGTPVNGIYRDKPNVMAPNGVNTTVDLGGVNYEPDDFPNFFGTSAAAPHVAAVGALLSEATTKYYGTQLTPASMKSILETTALDMGDAGHDVATGYGYTQADAALITLANPTPLAIDLVYDTTLIPGIDTIQVTIFGEYFTDGSIIYFNGEPVGGDQIISGDSSITATILPFGPELFTEPFGVYNPSQPQTNGTDGGLSDPIYLTQKETVLITIADKTKKYGEVLPAFTAESIVLADTEGNVVSLETSDLTAQEIARIQAIVFEAPNVSALTNAGLWAIKATTTDPLNPLSGVVATDPLDIALLEQYDFVIFDGLLNIEKMDMTIIPQETTITYGDPLGDLQFDYLFNDDPGSNVEITPEDNAAILSAVSTAHATVLVNARATALVNASATALVNYSFLVSATATALVNSSDVFDLEFDDPDVLFDATALVNGTATATVLVNGVARATVLVNATALVNGTATVLVNGTATPLVNGTATVLVNANATALVNSSTINGNSNSQAIVILGEEDIDILLGNATGEIVLQSMNLFPSTDAGEHWIVPGTALLPNFNVTYEVGGPLNVLPAPATITFDPLSLLQVYDGQPKSVTVLTEPNELAVDIMYDEFAEAPVNVGIYEVVVSSADANFSGETSAFLTIDQAMITVTADPQLKIYGEVDPPFTHQLTDGVLFGEDSFSGILDREEGEDVGDYAIQLGDLTAGPNYDLFFESGDLTIQQADLAVAAESGFKIYGMNDPSFTFLVTSGALVGEDAFSGNLTRELGENVGTYAILQGDVTAGSNYNLTFTDADFIIDPALFTVTAVEQTKFYGETDPELSYQITVGELFFEDSFMGALVREEGEDVGIYEVLVGDLFVSNNYTMTFESNTFTINKTLLTVEGDLLLKTYGDPDPELTYQVIAGALVGEDAFSGYLTREEGEGVGQYATLVGDLSAGSNYALSFYSGSLIIEQASLTVEADDLSKDFGESDPALTYQIVEGALVNGDGFSGTLSRQSGQDAGTYDILLGTLDAGDNYALTFQGGTFTINALSITVAADNNSKIYGESDPTLTYQVVSGSGAGSTFSGSLSREPGDDAGEYTITQGTLDVGTNYELNFIEGTFTIDQAYLLIKMKPKYQFTWEGNTNPDISFAYYGFVNGDDKSDLDDLGYTIWPNYYGQEGIFKVYPQASSNNYYISVRKGYLIVFDDESTGGNGNVAATPGYKVSEVEDENDGTKEIVAFPNPTNGNVTLQLHDYIVTSDNIAVFDISGNKCNVEDLRPSGQTMEINLSNLEKGVYFIQVKLPDAVEMIRIIKQ